MAEVRALAVRDGMAFDMAARQVDDVEARQVRMLREIDDADEVAWRRSCAVRIERRLGAREQRGIDPGGRSGAPRRSAGPAATGGKGRTQQRRREWGCDAAAAVISSPPAPAAPRRNISRRFNDIVALRVKRAL